MEQKRYPSRPPFRSLLSEHSLFPFPYRFVIQSTIVPVCAGRQIKCGYKTGDIMKKIFEWAAVLASAMMIAFMAVPAHAQLMLAHEGHHSGDCAIKSGAFPVAFSAYEKPKGELPPTHAYCDHVPETGELYFTVDLTDPESREIPIALRLVMEGHGEGGHEIMSIPAKPYPSGSITFTVNLEELGQYALLLETEKDGKMTQAVRIPVHVGGGGGHDGHGGGIGMTEIALILGAAGIAAFFLLRRRTSAKMS